MTSKEALESLVKLYIDIQNGTSTIFNTRETLEKLNFIKQDLERLEVLEKAYEEQSEAYTDIYLANEKYYEENEKLKERLETLEIENEQLKGNEDIVSNYAYSLKEENEKLKKAIEVLKKVVIIPLEDDFSKVKIDKTTKKRNTLLCFKY